MTARTVAVEVPDALDGQRIDRVVAMLTDCSRAEAAELVADGAVQVDGEVVTRGADRLAVGMQVDIEVPAATRAELPASDPTVALAVVHEDPDVVVIDKPADLVVHPGAGNPDGTLVNGLLARYPEVASVGDPNRPGIVHRLDRGTSGLLAVARTDRAYDSLVAQLAARDVHRQYEALVWGHPDSPRGVVDAPIGRSAKHPTKMAVSERGKPARTAYEVVATFDDPVTVAEVRCRLETGRTHQIRV
ncbi:MAG: RluA family pseudouridine synthase, partial [Acidimicrobiales bacterium]|nr:RluA family pseudouridine synthase [Acidimicrobiales bacterium]